ncbi:hypothetical protein [uncultured Bacteroides sp.]|uniref:hypothetical protein n=1 Tax=uncultured Bacteroides sp. TaxID=162156 RepID=UPI00205D3B82|nr:hypothetical protein [uncultured Bacteroides sp.]DAJ86869.1 MAG TPA: hypothetical protein [Caudoviricetes sp.]
MKYGLIYKVPFATLENVPCVVEIEKEGYSGKVTELIPASSPFTVEIGDEEFLYTPTRLSTAVIRIVGSDYLQSLFSTAYQEYRVTFKMSNAVVWCGFIKPELYTQDYSAETFELELECMSGISTLEHIDYKQVGDNREFVSLWDLLKTCISSANSQYTGIYVPHIYAQNAEDYTAGINVLENMTVSEQDFFDEEDKPMKLKEVLEEVCKFLNWTCVDWKGELYFVDNDHVGEFYEYRPDTFVKMGISTPKFHNVQRIGFAGAGHSLDILPGYNKVTVKCSNYPVGEIVIDEDFDKLKQLNIVDNSAESRASRRIFLSPSRWNMYLYDGEKVVDNSAIDNYGDRARMLEGGILMKCCVYNRHKNADGKWVPDIIDYSFNHAIQIRYPEKARGTDYSSSKTKIMSFKGAAAIYSDSAIAISYSLKVKTEDTDLGLLENSYAISGSEVSFHIRIGDNYYGSVYSENPKWSKNPKSILTVKLESYNNDSSLDYVNVVNQKTLSMPYTGLNGCIIPIENPMYGELEFTILCPEIMRKNNFFRHDRYGVILKDFKVEFKTRDGLQDNSNSHSDRIYENIVNENFINELDEIEFKISSYNNDGSCYSKVMLGESYLTDNLYSALEGKMVRPEEQLIRRIIKRYSAPRIKLTQVIKATPDLTPLSRLYDNFMVNKIFINAGGTIDYKMNQFECVMIEV